MVMGFKHQPIRSMVCVVGLQPTRLTPPHFECGMFSNFITRRYLSQADFLPHSYFQHQLVNDVVNPNPFHYAEQIDQCALLGITQQLRHLCLSHLYYARSLYNDGCSSNSTQLFRNAHLNYVRTQRFQHHHLYILNYTILDFICQALFLLFF